MVDIHNYKKRLERTLEQVEQAKISEISKQNKKDIFDFHNFCFTQEISYGKIQRYVYDLSKLAKMLHKDFRKATREDLQKVVVEIEKTDYAHETKRSFKIIIRKFYKWLKGIDDKGIYPNEVKWITVPTKNGNHKLPEELLTEEDITNLINHCINERDKAFISCLYESGCRIGEMMNLKLKNIAFDDYGAKITVFGKTGSRRIRLVSSVGYLQNYLNHHLDKNNPESFVWIKSDKELIGYARLGNIVVESANKAGIKKKVNMHSFRHARATHLANFLTESQLKEVFGWSRGSNTPGIYVHLSSRDTDVAIMRVYGKEIKDKDKEKNLLSPKKCPRCKTENEATNKFCKLCGMVLDKGEANKMIKEDLVRTNVDEVMDKLIENPEVVKFLEMKIQELKV